MINHFLSIDFSFFFSPIFPFIIIHKEKRKLYSFKPIFSNSNFEMRKMIDKSCFFLISCLE